MVPISQSSERALLLVALFSSGCNSAGSRPPSYQPAVTLPIWSEVQQVTPILPGGRLGLVDRAATWAHTRAIKLALRRGTAVPPQSPARVTVTPSRHGNLILHDGRTLSYSILVDSQNQERVRLQYPNGVIVSIESPVHYSDEDEDDC